MEATNPLELQADSLSGDIRNPILDLLRGMEKPWTKLSQYEQQRRIDAAERIGRDAVRGAVAIVGERGFPSLESTTGKWSVKDGVIKLEVTCAATRETITSLATHGSGPAILALANAGAYFGERERALADLDQPALALDTKAGEGAGTAAEGDRSGTEADAGTGEAASLGTVSQQALGKIARRRGKGAAAAEPGATADETAAAANAAALGKGMSELSPERAAANAAAGQPASGNAGQAKPFDAGDIPPGLDRRRGRNATKAPAAPADPTRVPDPVA